MLRARGSESRMKFDTSVGTDPLLHEQYHSWLFEIYHENSKLSADRIPLHLSQPPTSIERYLTTRSFRQYQTHARVSLPSTLSSQESVQDVMSRRRSGRDLAG